MLEYGDPGYMEENDGPRLHRITFSVLAAAIVVVILRLFSRLYLVRARRFTLSELLIVISIVVDIASCVLIHFQIKTGMGRHVEYSRMHPAMWQMSMKVGLAQNAVYQALIGLIKSSILAQYYSLALPGMQKRVVAGVAAFVVIFTLFTTIGGIFQCIPVRNAWDITKFPQGCWNMETANYVQSSINTLVDLVIFIIPFPAMAKLNMERKKKVALVVTFCVGLFAIACSLVRLRNIKHFNGVGDFTYVADMVPIWGAIECNAGIICASFPFIVPLFRWVGGSIVQSLTGTRTNNTSGHDHELQRSQERARPSNLKRQLEWHEIQSETIENIDVEEIDRDLPRRSSDTEMRSVDRVKQREVLPKRDQHIEFG